MFDWWLFALPRQKICVAGSIAAVGAGFSNDGALTKWED
jgi:hypothetical protein